MNTANAVVEREEPQVPAPLQEGDETLLMIARAARDPQVDIDKFERLMAWKERIETRAKEEMFNAAMSAAQAEMPAVVRDRANDHTKSRYATLEAIAAAVAPVYTKHGFSLSFGAKQSTLQGYYCVTCIASHAAGHSRPYEADLPADLAGSQGKVNKTPIQAFGSTMSYGRRYLTCLIFNIAIKDEDDDGNAASAGEKISEEQATELRKLAEEVGADLERFCRYFKIEAIPDIAAKDFDRALAALEAKRAKQ